MTAHIKLLIFTISLICTFDLISCKESGRQSGEKNVIGNRVIDDAGILTNDQKKNIFSQIEELENQTGSQIALVFIKSLEGQDINQYSYKKFGNLGLGRPSYDDGVLITVAIQDRRSRIEVGLGLEKIIKDEIAARIIREQMSPKFREQKFYEGITGAIDEIAGLIIANRDMIGQRP